MVERDQQNQDQCQFNGSPGYVKLREKLIRLYDQVEKKVPPFAPFVGLAMLFTVAVATAKEKVSKRQSGKNPQAA